VRKAEESPLLEAVAREWLLQTQHSIICHGSMLPSNGHIFLLHCSDFQPSCHGIFYKTFRVRFMCTFCIIFPFLLFECSGLIGWKCTTAVCYIVNVLVCNCLLYCNRNVSIPYF
jgi:hypothetical protein